MFSLDEKWLKENYFEGNAENTTVGMRVWVKGFDFWDEVLFPHIVTEVGIDSIKSYEDNLEYTIHPLDRGMKVNGEWFIKK